MRPSASLTLACGLLLLLAGRSLGEQPSSPAAAAPQTAEEAAALPQAAEEAPEDPDDPYRRFVHADHRTRFLEARITCMACHVIGMTTGTDDFQAVKRVDSAVLVPAREACHDCHTGALRFPRAPSRCDGCHTNLASLLPEDHDQGWAADHGEASLVHGSSCDLCHPVSDCTTCHARRDQGQHRVHPATFRATHGIEARLDAARCQRCHLRSSCEACHAGGGL
jgi:hypothetical protein